MRRGPAPDAIAHAGGRHLCECIGDCNGDDAVSIDELVLAVSIALGKNETSDCLVADRDGSGTVQIDELIAAVNVALQGCGAEGCPIEAGTYTLTQTSGGMVQVGTLAIPFPAGGTMVLDVQTASQPDCFHDAVVPFPGGFTSPAYCIPGTGYTARLIQRACGVGRVASSGGGDYTISELGDSSSQAECNNQQQCVPGIDDKIRLDVTVGDGTPDQCAAGQANVVLAVPVETLVWIDETMPMNVSGRRWGVQPRDRPVAFAHRADVRFHHRHQHGGLGRSLGRRLYDRAHGSADPLQQQRDVLGHRRSDHDHRCIRRAGLGKRAAVRYQLHGPFSEHGQRAGTAFRRQLRCASSH